MAGPWHALTDPEVTKIKGQILSLGLGF